jgi:estrogen-related receptor beta like 1
VNALIYIVSELKKLGISFDFGPIKLKQGFGEGCIFALQSLVDLAITKSDPFKKPIHSTDECS